MAFVRALDLTLRGTDAKRQLAGSLEEQQTTIRSRQHECRFIVARIAILHTLEAQLWTPTGISKCGPVPRHLNRANASRDRPEITRLQRRSGVLLGELSHDVRTKLIGNEAPNPTEDYSILQRSHISLFVKMVPIPAPSQNVHAQGALHGQLEGSRKGCG